MLGVLNVYLKQRFCGQLSWESERNRRRDARGASRTGAFRPIG